MKKTFFFAAVAAISLLAVSCSKDINDKQTFKATAEQAAEQGKLSLSGTTLRWSQNDTISIYDAVGASGLYLATSTDNTQHTRFAYYSGVGVSEPPYTAVYPASMHTSANAVTLPATQFSHSGALRKLPMYAVSDNANLHFYNLCGLVRFRLSASSDVSLSSIAVATAGKATNGSAVVSNSGTAVELGSLSGTTTTTLRMVSAPSIASAHDFYMYLPAGSYSSFVITMTAEGGATCIKTANSAIVIERGKITTITLSGLSFGGGLPQGALPGVFSVASGRTVHFSQGNLQYIGSAATPYWKFAEHQYDILGTTTGQNSAAANVDRDLFGWGTSGWNNGNTYYQPYNTSNTGNSSDGYGYGPMDGSSYTYNLTGSYANADWGVYNAISNGGNVAGLWRTLTHDEWGYLFNTRSSSTVNGTANARYAKGTVNSVAGVILFPDSYTHPDGVAQPTNINSSGANFTGNNYSTSDWTAMQTAGAVFLPAAGFRIGPAVNNVRTYGYYWSSSYYSIVYACDVYFFNDNLITEGSSYRRNGFSVRLVLG